MSLVGELSTYPISSKAKSIVSVSKLPFFTSGDRSANRAVIFIGGLWNGLMDPSYVVKLSSELEKAGWRFCQMVWSGNYDGFGTGSLDRDVMEMGALVKHLRTHCGVKKVVVMGHSTGSQDVIHYLSSPQSDDECRPEVDGGIMQAPASDREGLQNEKEWTDLLEPAKAMIEAGKGDHLLDWEFCKANNVKISAYRLFSLLAVGGDDDYFSNDLPDHPDSSPHKHPLSTSFGSLSAPALALWSEKDEFNTLSPEARAALLDRWRAAGGEKLQVSVIRNADHAVKGAETQEDMCGVVVDWLKRNFE